MTFNPGIPTPSEALSASQGEIQTNFSQTNTLFAVDHVTFDSADAGNRGKHYKVTFPDWVKPPQATVNPQTAANEIALYGGDDGTESQLYLRRESNGTVIQMTSSSTGDPVAAVGGQTFLPGGIIMKWGNRSGVADGATINFNADTSNFPTNCFQVWISIYDGAVGATGNTFAWVRPGSVATTGFRVSCISRLSTAPSTASFAYLAIGN